MYVTGGLHQRRKILYFQRLGEGAGLCGPIGCLPHWIPPRQLYLGETGGSVSLSLTQSSFIRAFAPRALSMLSQHIAGSGRCRSAAACGRCIQPQLFRTNSGKCSAYCRRGADVPLKYWFQQTGCPCHPETIFSCTGGRHGTGWAASHSHLLSSAIQGTGLPELRSVGLTDAVCTRQTFRRRRIVTPMPASVIRAGQTCRFCRSMSECCF